VESCAALAGCLLAAVVSAPAFCAELPPPTGRYSIGSTIVHWVDESRRETGGERANGFREVMVQAWYPAEHGKGQAIPYIPELQQIMPYRKELDRRGFSLLGAGIGQLQHLPTRALRDAPISDAQPRYPLLLFSPGNGVPRWLYTSLVEEMASHGYLVAAIDHPYSVAIVALPDGRVVLQSPDGPETQFERLAQIRAADARFVLDRLAAAPQFRDRIDVSGVGMFGHSIGGVAAVQAAADDRRFLAVANLDGGDGELDTLIQRGVGAPLMLITKSGPTPQAATDKDLALWGMTRSRYQKLMDEVDKRRSAIRDRLRAPAYRVAIAGAKHMSFSDAGFVERDSRGIDPRRTTEIVRRYLVAFFDWHLKDRSEGLMPVLMEQMPEATFERISPQK
jgi:predicted dienelactone hydrolase